MTGRIRHYEGVAAYLRILRTLAWPYSAAAMARLPISMAPLAMVLLIHQVKGSYSAAGLVTGAFALAQAFTGPLWGRALDRWGQTKVIGPGALTGACLLVGLDLAAVADASMPLLVGLAVLAGAALVPISPATRALFRAELPDAADRHAAFSLDTATVELIFVVGPLAVAALVLGPAFGPLLATAGLLLVGGVGYALAPTVRRLAGHRGVLHADTTRLGRLLTWPVLALIAVSTLVSIGFGQLDVSVAATALHVLGSQTDVGMLFTALAGGSAVGGLGYGARAWRHDKGRMLPVMVGVFSIGLLAVGGLIIFAGRLVATDPAVLLVLLFCTGLTIAPGLIIQSALMDQMAPRHRLSEGQAWLNTAFSSGAALGTAVAGPVLDHAGAGYGFVGAGSAVVLAALVALVLQPALAPGAGSGSSTVEPDQPAHPGQSAQPARTASSRP
jgi:MFS family permease